MENIYVSASIMLCTNVRLLNWRDMSLPRCGNGFSHSHHCWFFPRFSALTRYIHLLYILCIHIKDVRIVNDYEISYVYLSFLRHFTRTHTQHKHAHTHPHTHIHIHIGIHSHVVKNFWYFYNFEILKHSTRCRGGWYRRLCRVTQLNGFNYFVNQAFDNNVKDNWNFPSWRQCRW